MTISLVPAAGRTAPVKKDVEKAVTDEINDQINKNRNAQYWEEMFYSIFKQLSKFKNLKDVVVVIFIFVFCFLALLLLFFLFRNFSSRKYMTQKDAELETKHYDYVFDLKVLDDFISQKNYSEAVLYIHRCSVFYLIKKRMIFNINLTNSSIYMKIKDTAIKQSFNIISRLSEKILFDEYHAAYDDAVDCRKEFTENFI